MSNDLPLPFASVADANPAAGQTSSVAEPPKTGRGRPKKSDRAASGRKNQASEGGQGEANTLAWRRSLAVSNATLRAARWSDGDVRQWETAPIVEQHIFGVTGRKDEKSQFDDEKKTTIYEARAAFMPPGFDAVVAHFDLRLAPLIRRPHSIHLPAWLRLNEPQGVRMPDGQTMSALDAIESRLPVVIEAVVDNLLSGRWAWRVAEEAVAQRVSVFHGEHDLTAGGIESARQAIVDRLLRCSREQQPVVLDVWGAFNLGADTSRRIYPSQLFKEKNDGVPEYYRVAVLGDESGDFAFRDVKIANALRTIDRWYALFGVIGQPIPVEPMGWSQTYRANLRRGHEQAPTLLRKLLTDPTPVSVSENELRYLAANLLFGGLFSLDNEKGELSVSPQAADTPEMPELDEAV